MRRISLVIVAAAAIGVALQGPALAAADTGTTAVTAPRVTAQDPEGEPQQEGGAKAEEKADDQGASESKGGLSTRMSDLIQTVDELEKRLGELESKLK
ncbi:hypothetical protein [Nocardia sp. XZ_19_385]|uniref:hypothetical protein n=1 Tax=Nocardia sp. XZ_19_385 TaxID=2769488 RepID=UPI00188F6037|nr:hypothetical protein [Nocardia sp. XZ_19_385]